MINDSYKEEVKSLMRKFMVSNNLTVIPGIFLPLSDDNLNVLIDRLGTNLDDKDRETYLNSLKRCTKRGLQ